MKRRSLLKALGFGATSATIGAGFTSAASTAAQAQDRLIPTVNAPSPWLNKPGPELDVQTWLQGGPLTLDSMRGSIIAIDFFQLWCPMCNTFTGPVFNWWYEQRFAQEIAQGRLKLVGIHTVFEGFEYQSIDRLRSYVKEKNKRYPIAHDRKDPDWFLPATMKAWDNRATPTVAIVDRFGLVRFHKAGRFDAEAVSLQIDGLLARA